jgi:hypothetical protein
MKGASKLGLSLKWSDGNTKVMKMEDRFGKTVSFGLPAYKSLDGFKVCPGAGACAAVCYARQGQYERDSVKATREHNLAFIRNRGLRAFVRAAIRDIKRIDAKLIRVHDSGDFFSQGYLNAWYRIARASGRSVRFYAYTKSLHLDIYRNKPENFSVIQSFGGLHDASVNEEMPVARIFATHGARRRQGFQNGANTDLLAIQGKGGAKIGLVYHGVKVLTPAQTRHFGADSDKASV